MSVTSWTLATHGMGPTNYSWLAMCACAQPGGRVCSARAARGRPLPPGEQARSALTTTVDLLRGIYAFGFEKPSAIQARAVGPILRGRDVVAQAQSGTGKTSMIALTACQLVDPRSAE